jgi:SAM-dependent methyltransferase
MLYANRLRAGSFGEDALLYDRARPSYPDAMIDDLVRDSPRAILDVGCGTGISTRAFSTRGLDVLGIEPDARMAAVATEHGLDVEVGTFEAWDPRGRAFDLLVCGQSWHWVDPAAGPEKAADVLLPFGKIALFWNHGTQDQELSDALHGVYDELAPGMEENSIVLRDLGRERAEEAARSFDATLRFTPSKIRSYPWSKRYDADEWLDNLMTHSDHRTMDKKARETLFSAIADVIERFGGFVEMNYRCTLLGATRIAGV